MTGSRTRAQRLLLTVVGLALLGIYSLAQRGTSGGAGSELATQPATERTTDGGSGAVAEAFRDRASDLQVEGVGVVRRVLLDDRDGSRHQRFILELANGQTVLVAHNIDLAPRLTSLDRGDTVAFYGEYEWNADGGVIHWTHRDPARRHVAGWLRHEGRTVQ